MKGALTYQNLTHRYYMEAALKPGLPVQHYSRPGKHKRATKTNTPLFTAVFVAYIAVIYYWIGHSPRVGGMGNMS